ncbi:YncE family protein [Pseudomonas edaphica]|uniref:YncE family protein n=1 Tax=Pseudomonas edaphica TaxID=2006980 RepID=UPI003D109631
MSSRPTDSYDLDLEPPTSYFPAVQLQPQFTSTPPLYPETAVWGMGIRHGSPAMFTFSPWTGRVLGDYYAIRIQDLINPAGSNAISDLGASAYHLTVNKLPQGEVAMFGRLVRAISLQESRSITQTILIKLTNPGGRDQEVTKKWHSGLNMSIEGKPTGSVLNKSNTEDGLWCLITKYLYLRKNDIITVRYDGLAVEHVVSPEEADGPGPIRVFISWDIIKKGRQSGPVEVAFTVKDVVGNVPEGEWQYCKAYKLVSELDSKFLQYPIFLVDDVESDQLDLNLNNRSKLKVAVYPPRKSPKPSPQNQIMVVFELFPGKKGQSKTVTLGPFPDTNKSYEEIPVSYDLFTELAKERFQVKYESRTSAGVLLGESGSYTVSVTGLPVSMPAVTVSPFEAGLIPSNTDIDVILPTYQPHNVFLLETLVLEALDGSVSLTLPQPAGIQGGKRRVTKEALKAFEGLGPFQIYYTTDDGEGTSASLRESVKLQAQVGERVSVLEAPIIQGSRRNNIDPADVKDPEILLLFPYGNTIAGDVLYWSVVGKDANGSASGKILINSAYAGAALPLVFFPFDRKVLDNNVNASIRVSYSIERAGPPRQVLRSSVLDLTVGADVKLELPKVLEAGSLQDQLDPKAVVKGATVEVAFKQMRADDQIFVEWLGAYGVSSIVVQVAGDPKTNKVNATIPPEVISKGVRPNGNKITVRYSFTRGQFTYKSEILTLVLQPLAKLPTPIIDGAGETLLPLFSLPNTAHTRIPAWDLINKDQLMWMTNEGTFADGTSYIEDTYTASEVTADGVVKGISAPTPVDQLRRLKDGSHLTIRFWVSFAQIPDKDTALLFGTAEYIVQALAATLPAPSFANKPGAAITVYPLDYEKNAIVAVAYPAMTATQKIVLEWIYPDGTLATIAAQNGVAGGRVDFAISAPIITASVGKVITLRYKVTSGTRVTSSDAQQLTLQAIRATDLPQAVINGVVDKGMLDLTAFNGDGLLALSPWRLSAAGQKVSITARAEGVEPLSVLRGYPINGVEAASGLKNVAVSRTWLQGVRNGSSIVIECRVTFDGSDDVSTSVVFPVTTYTVKQRTGVIANVAVGQSPQFVVLSKAGDKAFVSNHHGNSISVIDVTARKVIDTIPGINSPFKMVLSPDGSRLYVANFFGRTVTVINPATHGVLMRFDVKGVDVVQGVELNGDGSRLFVSTNVPSLIVVLDAISGSELRRIPTTPNPVAMALNPEKTQIYFTAEQQVAAVNANGLSGVVGKVAGFSRPQDLVFNPNNIPSARIYVADNDFVRIINPVNNALIKSLGGFHYAWGVKMHPTARQCYVGSVGPGGTTSYRDSLFVIDTVTETVINRFTGFDNLADITFTSDGNLALLVNQATGIVSFFSI